MVSVDTIFAVASGQGTAGIAVLRVSGPQVCSLVKSVAGVLPEPRRATLRHLTDSVSGDVVDCGLVIYFPGPGSFTGEDVVEFHVHGGMAVVAGMTRVFAAFPGVRPAEPGEFTRRAFANGRMDLVEVEGLADLLRAQTSRQRELAIHHVLGRASSVYDEWRTTLLKALARIEAAVDFSEEEGVAEAALSGIDDSISGLARAMAEAVEATGRAVAIRDGVKVVLAGMPNTGKSSLLNALARRDAAIVSALAGTTRDVIEVAVDIDGFAVTLIDTAGLRAGATDEIELLGMARTWREVQGGEIVVWVSAIDVPGSELIVAGVVPSILVRNKIDLAAVELGLNRNESLVEVMGLSIPAIGVSASSGAGMTDFLGVLAALIRDKYGRDECETIVRERHRSAIVESIRHLNESRRHSKSELELVAEDLRRAAQSLGRVTGRIDVEDLLSSIFSEFCIGK